MSQFGPGPDLALLLLGSYRKLINATVLELAARGFDDVRPVHDFAMRAIVSGADTASELGRRMSISKQAAAKTIETLLERSYVTRYADPIDRRRKRVEVTPLGFEVMRQGEAILNDLRAEWERQLGRKELALLEAQLSSLVGDSPVRIEAPGWIAQDLG